MKFEGEFKNGKKWNGSGYKDGKIIYKLVVGKGIIKEYNNSNILIFKGEYLNEKKNKKGKNFISNRAKICKGQLKFEGEYINGKRNGLGKEYCFEYSGIWRI